MRIFIHHIRGSRICLSGARHWWKEHNLDWTDFLNNGIEEEVLLKTGDAHARRVVEYAHGQQ